MRLYKLYELYKLTHFWVNMLKTIAVFLITGAVLSAYQCPDIPIQIFPKNNPWNQNISKVEVNKNSNDYIESIGRKNSLKPWFGSARGIPYSLVSNGKEYPVEINDNGKPEDSDKGPYKIPFDAQKEAGENPRVIVVDTKSHLLYEFLNGQTGLTGRPNTWFVFSAAIFNLDSNDLRKEKAYSADPAGMAILPGLVRYQDITKGSLDHAVRAVVNRIDDRYVYPARNSPALNKDPKLPAMGQRFRLKDSVDISKLGPQAQIIAVGLKKYGFIIADRGRLPYIYGTLDERWNDGDLATLESLQMGDFEAIIESTAAEAAFAGTGGTAPLEKIKIYGGPYLKGKGKVGFLNLPGGKLTIKIMNSQNKPVRNLDIKAPLVLWDLTDSSGNPVETGNYFIQIEDAKKNSREIQVKVE